MSTLLLRFKKERFQAAAAVFISDPVFLLAFVLALTSCAFAYPKVSYINFEVLVCLFNLMLVIKAFEELRLLDKFAVNIINRCTNSRSVSLVLIMMSFFAAMLITNDIALLTLVPLALIISRKAKMNVLATVILQTLAANIGSSLTPMGNPQNLFIFTYYRLTAAQFFLPVLFFVVLGLVWLYFLNIKNPKHALDIALENIEIESKAKAVVWIVLFGIIILSVFKLINYPAVLLLTITVTMVMDKGLFTKVDYHLLATFVCFFIFIGNMSSISGIIDFMNSHLDSGRETYFYSILLSQFISNVPCTVFLSKFTTSWRELLLGVNIGGMGTIIASLASVISYKLFVRENAESGKAYLIKYTLYNLLSLTVFTLINYIVVIL